MALRSAQVEAPFTAATVVAVGPTTETVLLVAFVRDGSGRWTACVPVGPVAADVDSAVAGNSAESSTNGLVDPTSTQLRASGAMLAYAPPPASVDGVVWGIHNGRKWGGLGVEDQSARASAVGSCAIEASVKGKSKSKGWPMSS